MQRAPGWDRRSKSSAGRLNEDQSSTAQLEITAAIADAEEGLRRRDEGVARASAGAHLGWKAYAERNLSELIAEGHQFTSDDLRARTGEPLGTSPTIFGALIQAAARADRITQVGWVTSSRPEAHARPVRLWQPTGGGDS